MTLSGFVTQVLTAKTMCGLQLVTTTSAQQYRPWRFLVLLVTLVLLLVIQPIIREFSGRGQAFDVLYSLVLVGLPLFPFLRESGR